MRSYRTEKYNNLKLKNSMGRVNSGDIDYRGQNQ